MYTINFCQHNTLPSNKIIIINQSLSSMSVKQEENEKMKRIRYSYPPKFFCKAGNHVANFCKNRDCKFEALCCSDQGCFICRTNHEDCVFGEFNQLIKRIDARLSFENRIKMNFLIIEQQILKQLEISRREILDKEYLWESNPVSKRINELFFKGNPLELCGAEMNQICQELLMKATKERAEQCQRKFQKEVRSLTQSILDTRDRHLDSILSLGKRQQIQEDMDLQLKQEPRLEQKDVVLQSRSSQIKKDEHITDHSIDSLILQGNPERASMITFIMEELGTPSQLKLLFRASQHNYRSQAFHTACNKIKNTFTLVLTEYNKIFAGFTPLEWTSNGFYIPDTSLGSFLLHLNLREKMALKYPKRAIYDHSHKGPSFGSGDIMIGDKCNIDANNSANFPYSYQGVNKYKREDQSSWTMFSGAKFGKKFNVLEYEVYEVIK